MMSMQDLAPTPDHDRYLLAKGFIDARDSQASPIYGMFLSLSTREHTIYLKELFTREPIDKEMSYADMLARIERDAGVQDIDMQRYTDGLHDHLYLSRTLEAGHASHDHHQAEHTIAQHCAEVLGINAIVFADILEVDGATVSTLLPELDLKSGTVGGEAHELPDGEGSGDEDDDKASEIFLACGPVLDTLSGTAAGELREGDLIMAELPKDSLYYRFLMDRDPDFTGTMSCEVTGVKLDDVGAAVVALKIADGVYGAIRLSESVRLRRAPEPDANEGAALPRPEIIFAVVSAAAFLAVLYFVLRDLW